MRFGKAEAGAGAGADRIGERWNRAARASPRISALRSVILGVVVLVALGAVVVRIMSDPRGGTPGPAERPRELEVAPIEGLAPTGRLPRREIGNRVPVRFRWRRIESASYYFVRVFGPRGEPVDRGQVTAPPFESHEASREAYLAGGEFSWEVTAYTADARPIGRSQRVTFTVE